MAGPNFDDLKDQVLTQLKERTSVLLADFQKDVEPELTKIAGWTVEAIKIGNTRMLESCLAQLYLVGEWQRIKGQNVVLGIVSDVALTAARVGIWFLIASAENLKTKVKGVQP